MRMKIFFLSALLAGCVCANSVHAKPNVPQQRPTDPIDKSDLVKPLRDFFGKAKQPVLFQKESSGVSGYLAEQFQQLFRYGDPGGTPSRDVTCPIVDLLKSGDRRVTGCYDKKCSLQAVLLMDKNDRILSAGAIMDETPAPGSQDKPGTGAYRTVVIFKERMNFDFSDDAGLRNWITERLGYSGKKLSRISFVRFDR